MNCVVVKPRAGHINDEPPGLPRCFFHSIKYRVHPCVFANRFQIVSLAVEQIVWSRHTLRIIDPWDHVNLPADFSFEKLGDFFFMSGIVEHNVVAIHGVCNALDCVGGKVLHGMAAWDGFRIPFPGDISVPLCGLIRFCAACAGTLTHFRLPGRPLLIGHALRHFLPGGGPVLRLLRVIFDRGAPVVWVHGRIVHAGLCLGHLESLAVQRPADGAGAAVQRGHELIPLDARLLVGGAVRLVVEVIEFGAHHALGGLVALAHLLRE